VVCVVCVMCVCVWIYLLFTEERKILMIVGKSNFVRLWAKNSTWKTLKFEPQASAVKIRLLMS